MKKMVSVLITLSLIFTMSTVTDTEQVIPPAENEKVKNFFIKEIFLKFSTMHNNNTHLWSKILLQGKMGNFCNR